VSVRLGYFVAVAGTLLALASACSDAAAPPLAADAGETTDASPDAPEKHAEATQRETRSGARASESKRADAGAGAGRRRDASPSDAEAGPTSGEPAPGSDPEPSEDGPEILTQRYGNSRTGANLNERVLTPDNVEKLSLLGAFRVDGEIYAQVLVAAGVEVAGQRHALALVATMNNTLYAFDADVAPADAFLWQQGLHGELGTPAFCARNVGGPNGILSTPVIDKAHGHVYIVARDCDPMFPPEMPHCQQRLFQLALTSGEVLQSVVIEGEVQVADASGQLQSTRFDPSAQWNRPGLLLHAGGLVIAFGSGPAGNQHEEDFVYHGWAFRFRVSDLSRAPEVYCTTPRGRGGSVWQAGSAPAADQLGVYLTGANGIQADSQTHPPEQWPASPVGQEDSIVRLSHDAWPTPQADIKAYWDDRSYVAQGNVFQHMESGDNGFGSSGPMLIPDTRLLLVGSKAGLVYLIDREDMHVVQAPLSPFTDLELQPGHTLYLHSWWGIPMITQAFVFFRPDIDNARYGYAYAWPANDRLRQLRFDYESQRLELTGTASVPDVVGGGNMELSADGAAANSGVLWATSRAGDGTGGPEGVLWAFDPKTLKVLWQVATPAWSKFNPPTVVRGRVFVPSTAPGGINQQVLVYGLPN
jgi:hypothetical protein